MDLIPALPYPTENKTNTALLAKRLSGWFPIEEGMGIRRPINHDLKR